MVTGNTVRVMVAVFAPDAFPEPALDRVIEVTKQRIKEYCVAVR